MIVEPKLCLVCGAVLVGRRRKYCGSDRCQRERKKLTTQRWKRKVNWDNAEYCREWRRRRAVTI